MTGFRKTRGEALTVSDIGDGVDFLASLIHEAYNRNSFQDALSTLSISLNLRAAMRWDSRLYYPNAVAGVEHAAIALPYCQTFLTERSLCNLFEFSKIGSFRSYKLRF